MTHIDRLTVTLPQEMAAMVKGVVQQGEYESDSEVVQEALRDWEAKRALQLEMSETLKADIDRGLADVAAGRVRDFDIDRIVARGRSRSPNP